MVQLERINDETFSEIYEGTNGNKMVTAILDTNCVRYMVFKRPHAGAKWKRIRMSQFNNDQKEKCLANATKVLNKT